MAQRLIVDWQTLKTLGWPYSRAHTWRLMHAGEFPKAFKLGTHHNSHPVWRWKDIQAHFKRLGLVFTDEEHP